jgi:phosphoglycolate phosphatase-like HAD superfamily hydrolase
VRLYLFDVDGTLIRADGAGRTALARAFAQVFQRNWESVDEAVGQVELRGRIDPWIHGQIARRLELDLEPHYPELIEAYLDHLRRCLAAQPGRILPGVLSLLQTLTQRDDAALGLLTGNLREGARIKLQGCGVPDCFPDGGFGEDGPDRPSLGRIAHRRCERRLGRSIPPGQVVVIGDTEHDVHTARVCGFIAVAVATGWTDPETLRASGPDLYLDDLTDPSTLP